MSATPSQPHGRNGVTIIETMVALGLLVTVMSVTASLAVQNSRLLAGNRAYRLAVDELSNRLDLLALMPPADLADAIKSLGADEFTGPLAGATLRGAVEAEDLGRRITLTLDWPGAVKRRPSVVLCAWSFTEPESEEQP